jgi:hypothetical protein
VGDGLTRHGQRQGQTPGVQRRLRPWRPDLRRTRLQVVRVRQEGGDLRGDERGVQKRFQGAGPRGVYRVQAMHGLVSPDAALDLPAHPVEVSDLPRANPGRQIRQEETGALRGVDPDEAKV